MKLFLYRLQRLCRSRPWLRLRQKISWLFYNPETLRSMMEAASSSLLGETVRVYIRPPMTKDARGQAYRDSCGLRSIDIHPNVVREGLDVFYSVWLHETGHHHFERMENRLPPEIEKEFLLNGPLLEWSKEKKKEWANDPREMAADSFMHEFDRIAAREAIDIYGSNDIRERIRALMNITILKKGD